MTVQQLLEYEWQCDDCVPCMARHAIVSAVDCFKSKDNPQSLMLCLQFDQVLFIKHNST